MLPLTVQAHTHTHRMSLDKANEPLRMARG